MFIDIEKAYDTIPLIKLWKPLEETRISLTLIKTVKELYRKSLSYIIQVYQKRWMGFETAIT
jgi:hypothetical protein